MSGHWEVQDEHQAYHVYAQFQRLMPIILLHSGASEVFDTERQDGASNLVC
jgi:hypothetical protein